MSMVWVSIQRGSARFSASFSCQRARQNCGGTVPADVRRALRRGTARGSAFSTSTTSTAARGQSWFGTVWNGFKIELSEKKHQQSHLGAI